MAEGLADLGLVRFSRDSRPVGAGFLVDDAHIITCAHVINASIGRSLDVTERPDAIGPVAVRVGGEWVPVEVALSPDGWIPPTDDKCGDVAVLTMPKGPPDGARAVPLRAPHRDDRHFVVQGFPDQTLLGATGWIRARLTIGQEWLQLEDDKQPGRAVTEGFSGAPVWDTTVNAVVGMAIAKDARAPAAKIAAMLPVTRLAGYWPPLGELLPSRLSLNPDFGRYWDPRARGVENAHVPGTYFTGRRRALTELTGWVIADPDLADNLRVVTGGPGSGKSAVLARLVTRSDPSFRRHYPCSPDDPVSELPAGAVDVAVYARSLDATQILAFLADTLESDSSDADDLVAALAALERPFTLVVDGLDESADPSSVAGTLRQLAAQTADIGVRLLVGTRPGPDHRLLDALGRTAAQHAIDLDASTYLEKADLRDYVRRRLLSDGVPVGKGRVRDTPYRGKEELADRVALRIAERAYPSFLIAALVAVDLARRAAVIDPDSAGQDQFPATVDDAMRSYLERFPAGEADRIEDLLRPLAYSYGDGLMPDKLWADLATALAARPGRGYGLDDIGSLLDQVADYLLEVTAGWSADGADRVYRLYHQALADHLREGDTGHGVPVEELAYRALLTAAPRGPGGAVDWDHAHPYLRGHLSDHAAAVRRLGDLVADPAFLVAAEPGPLAASLRRSRQLVTAGARTYRVAAHLLASPSERLFQLQLHAGRLGETELLHSLAALPTADGVRLAWVREPPYHDHVTLTGHTRWLRAVTVAELDDRIVVVSGGEDRTLQVWDLATEKPVGARLTGHTEPVMAAAVAELDGRPVVVSGGRDFTVRVSDLATGSLIGSPFTGHTHVIVAVAVTELGGRQVVVSGSWDGTVQLSDLATGDPVGVPFRDRAGVLSMTLGELDGRQVVVAGTMGDFVRVWDLAAGEPVGTYTGHTDSVTAVAIGELGRRPVVVSGSEDETVHIWDLATRDPIGDPFISNAEVWGVAVGELDGRPIVASGGEDQLVTVWDLATRELIGDPFIGHASAVEAVAITELDGTPVVVSNSVDETVRIWHIAKDRHLAVFHRAPVAALAATELDGRPVVISGSVDTTVRVWDLASGEPIGSPFAAHPNAVEAIAVTDFYSGKIAISSSRDGTEWVWEPMWGIPRRRRLAIGAGEELNPMVRNTRSVVALAVTELDQRFVVVSGCADGTVEVWDLATGNKIGKRYKGHTSPSGEDRENYRFVTDDLGTRAVAVCEYGGRRVVVSGGNDERVRIWDLVTREPAGDPYEGHTGSVEAVAIGELDGRQVVVSGGADQSVHVWDLNTRAPVGALYGGHTVGVTALAIGQRDGCPVVISGSADGMVRIWDLATRNDHVIIRIGSSILSVARHDAYVVIGHQKGLIAVQCA